MSERLTLLPCPFCGSSAEGDTGFFPLTNLLYVWCSNAECGCSPKGRGERMFLPEEWNHRAALRSPQPAEQQEAVAWTTELALETAKQIGSIGFTVCPENIWGDKGVALTRARPASVARRDPADHRADAHPVGHEEPDGDAFGSGRLPTLAEERANTRKEVSGRLALPLSRDSRQG